MTSSNEFLNATIESSGTVLGNSSIFEIASVRHHGNDNSETMKALVGYWELLIVLVGTPANILVLYLSLRFLLRSSKCPAASTSTRRHQSNLWFIISMTLADLFFTGLHAPIMFADYVFRIDYGAELCLTLYIVTHASTICSSISLLWLNVDKFLYLHQPLHYQRKVTSFRALIAVLIAWLTSFVWALFFILGPFTKYTAPCNFRPLNIEWYIAFAVVFFVLPTAVSSGISIYIAFVVIKVKRENEARRSSSTASSGRKGRRRSSGNAANAKTIAFVFTTTMWSAVTYLPYRIAYLLYISPIFPSISLPWSIPFSYFLVALLATNAAGNPFITILTQRQYSLAFTSLFPVRSYWRSFSSTDEKTCYESLDARHSQNPRRTSNKLRLDNCIL